MRNSRTSHSLTILFLGAVLMFATACGSRSAASEPEEGSGDSSTTTTIAPVDPVESVDELKALCKNFEDDSKYLPELPGPTPASSGRSFTSSEDKEQVIAAVTRGIMADFLATPVASVHWSEIDRGSVLGSTSPQSPADTEREAQRLREDLDAREAACNKLAEELGNALADDTVVETLTPEVASERGITQLAFWVYDSEFGTSGWLCRQAIPPDGIRLISWKRSFREGGNALGDTVVVAFDRRQMVAFDCPGEAFTGTQEGPAKLEEEQPASTPETEAPAPSETPSEAPSAGGDTDTGTGGGGGDTGTNPGPGGAGGEPGGGPAPCTGSPGCPGPGPGGGGGEPNPCAPGTCPGPGTSTTTTTTTTTTPPTTAPPTTQPPTTTTTPPTTAPPTTQPPTTTTTIPRIRVCDLAIQQVVEVTVAVQQANPDRYITDWVLDSNGRCKEPGGGNF